MPIVIADDLSDAQIKAFRLVANQSANWADWDDELLKLELEDLKNPDFDLDLTGFDLSEIDRLLSENRELKDDVNEEESPETTVVSKVGDLWLLGEHRLLCGDSTKLDQVQKLINGQVADMVFTDPPYNVKVSNISGIGIKKCHNEFPMASGEMSEQEFIDFLSSVFKNLVEVSKDGSIHYICMDWKHIYEIIVAGRNIYTEFKQLCVWNKGSGGMGTFYRSQHELIFVFKNGTAKHINNFGLGETGRYRTNVWDYTGMNNFVSENRDELLKMHPTVKPLQLVADAILDCSNYGDLILDLFGGSLLKAELYGWLKKEPQRENKEGSMDATSRCHFPEYDTEYFKQLTSEQLVTRIVKGYPKREWQKTRDRNEALDCRIYARAAAIALGIDRWSEQKWNEINETFIKNENQKKKGRPKIIRSKFI